MFKKRRVPSREKYKIVKVVKTGSKTRRVTIANQIGSTLTFMYDGNAWHWDSSGHLVDGDVSKKLNKEYRRYLKQESKNG